MRKVTYAVMHGIIHVPGMGQVGPTLSNIANAGAKGVEMEYDGDKFVNLTVTTGGKAYDVSVPILNFSHLVFAK